MKSRLHILKKAQTLSGPSLPQGLLRCDRNHPEDGEEGNCAQCHHFVFDEHCSSCSLLPLEWPFRRSLVWGGQENQSWKLGLLAKKCSGTFQPRWWSLCSWSVYLCLSEQGRKKIGEKSQYGQRGQQWNHLYLFWISVQMGNAEG